MQYLQYLLFIGNLNLYSQLNQLIYYLKNVILCLCFYVHNNLFNRNFEFLIPDAPELIANFLDGEQDMSCKRNAFMMLLHADQDRALAYLASCLDQVASFGDILQLVIVELIYKVSKTSTYNLNCFY